MKTISKLFILSALVLSVTFIACNNSENKDAEKAENTDGPEYTSKYICPMHCEGSGSAEPGTCPVCQMDLVENKNYKEESGDHDHGDMHDHGEDGHDHEHMDHDHDEMMAPETSDEDASDSSSME